MGKKREGVLERGEADYWGIGKRRRQREGRVRLLGVRKGRVEWYRSFCHFFGSMRITVQYILYNTVFPRQLI